MEGFLAQVLQRRRNHGTFRVLVVDEEERPDLVERFGVEDFPTLVVVEDRTVRARLDKPRGCREIERLPQPLAALDRERRVIAKRPSVRPRYARHTAPAVAVRLEVVDQPESRPR